MELKRNKVIYAICRGSTTFALNCLYEVKCYGAENIPEKGPALLLPKHQYLKDIPLEGLFLNKSCRRPGNWVMRSNLPWFLKYVGGVGIRRLDEIQKIRNKEQETPDKNLKLQYKKQRKDLTKEIREHNQKTMDYLEWLYTQGEIIVVHPEGTRSLGEMKPLKREFFDFTKKVQEKQGIEIPAIPMGIEYKSEHRVYLRAGEQLDVADPDISDIVEQEIRRLSNLE